MNEHDPLNNLLREWRSPEHGSDVEERIMDAYRTEFRSKNHPAWQRWWKARISVPVPLMVAAMILFAVLFWIRSKSAPTLPPDATGVITRVNATGFEPLPNGAAQLVPVKETRQ